MEESQVPNGLVAIIIPVYNTENYLDKCLDSVLAQSYTNLDIITVNDGSTDNSARILEEYASKDSRVRIITQKNKGLSAARNSGLEALKPNTEYIFFLDSDDWLPENAIQQLSICIEGKKADVVCGMYSSWSPEGKMLWNCPQSHFGKENVISRAEMFELLSNHLISKYTFSTCKLYRRVLFEGIRFPVGKVYEDSICHRIYGKCTRIAFLNEVVYHYLQRLGSIVHSGYDIHRLDKVELFIDRIQYLRQEGFPQYSTTCLGQAYVLMREILIQIPQFDSAIRKRVKNLRRLLDIEYQKSNFDGLSFRSRLSFWANNHLFWLLYYRWKLHYRNKRDAK